MLNRSIVGVPQPGVNPKESAHAPEQTKEAPAKNTKAAADNIKSPEKGGAKAG